MAGHVLWSGLESAATVAQLVGVDASGLISKIKQAAVTAHQNKEDCENLADRVHMIAELLPHVPDPEAMRPLAGRLDAALTEAHELVQSCQGKNRAHRLFNARRQAASFKNVQAKIDSFLLLFPVISYIGLARRLDGVGGVSVLNRASSSQLPADSQQESGEAMRFTLKEVTVATSNFAVVLGEGHSGTVYKGKLHDGREVAVKRLRDGLRCAEDTFGTELAILHPVRHENIVRLLSCCAEGTERLLVYEHMDNRTLRDYLDDVSPAAASSWRTRVAVLLGAACAVKHLHCRAVPLLIHCNVTSSNILLDRSMTPRLSGFGASVWRAPDVESQAVDVVQTHGYADPEYRNTGHVKPATDVYSLGVVMLEVLTGNQPNVAAWEDAGQRMIETTLVSWALPSIQDRKLGHVLDRRPASEPTPRQREALQLVANTAASCLLLHGNNRPAIADVVASLEKALQLICRDKLG